MVTRTTHRFFVTFDQDLTMLSASAFLVGSCYFIFLSYPEELEKTQRALDARSGQDVSKLSCMERFFTGRCGIERDPG